MAKFTGTPNIYSNGELAAVPDRILFLKSVKPLYYIKEGHKMPTDPFFYVIFGAVVVPNGKLTVYDVLSTSKPANSSPSI